MSSSEKHDNQCGSAYRYMFSFRMVVVTCQGLTLIIATTLGEGFRSDTRINDHFVFCRSDSPFVGPNQPFVGCTVTGDGREY